MDRNKEYKYLGLIILSMIAACVETDIYLPAFVDMMQYFSVSEGAIQSLLTCNFFGICLSGPLYGPLSDSFGRKKPLLIALAIFFVGSLVALAATTLPLMFIGRILQGLGSGGCFTLGFAIIFDAFQQEKAVKAMNRLCTFIPVIMAAAPLAGGMLNNHFGFRSNFLAIALLSFLSLFFCFLFLEETLDKSKRSSFQWSTLRNDFKQVLSHKGFWQLGLATSAIFSGYIAFLSGTSVLFIMELGLTKEQFPFVQAALLGAWVLAGLVVNKAIHWWGSDSIKKQGLIL